jgi:hypothetical protein
MFPSSLSATAFTWFTSLAPNSIFTWAQLKQNFHEYFYSGDSELRLSHLTTIKQKHNEPITYYIRRFSDTRNRYFNLNISDNDLPDLAYAGLSSHFKEKLKSHDFLMLSKSCKGLWIAKAEPGSLEASLGTMISLETMTMLTWLDMGVSCRMTRKSTCV